MLRCCTFALVGAMFLMAAPGSATPSGHWGDLASPKDPVLHFVDKKIDQGHRSGVIKEREFHRFQHARHALLRLKTKALADGVLTRHEYVRVRTSEQKLIHDLRQALSPRRTPPTHLQRIQPAASPRR